MRSLILTISIILFSTISSKEKIFFLIRHGETNFNTDPVPRVRGRIEVPLNDEGKAHAKAAGDFLANEDIGKIYYSTIDRAKTTAELVAGQHNGKVELVPDPLVIDISWGDWEGKTYKEAFGSEDGGDYFKHPERLTMPNGESFYSVMDRLRRFLIRFWEGDEKVCTIVSHGAITNVLSLMLIQAPLEKFWTMYMSACGVSKIKMKGISEFSVEYWNADHFLKDGEKKYLKK